MEDAALNVSPGGHSFHAPFKGSSSFDKFAFSPVALECSTSDAHASNLSIVFNNAVYDGNSVDFELACRDNGSEVCWDEQRLPDDKDIVQLGWNTPNFTVKRCSSPLLPSRNVVVLFQHALRQGLTFKLRGLLGNMLGYPTKSTKVLLASSKLANFLKAGKEHNRTSHKNMSVRGPKFEVLEGSDEANRKAQNAFVERLILDENSLHVEGHDQAPPKSSLGASAEGQIPKIKLPLTSGSSLWSLTSNGAGNSCGSDTSTSCQYQGSEEVALKMGFSEIPPNDTSSPHHVDNSELRNVLLTKEANNTCAEISQEHPNLPTRVRPENVEGNAPKVPQTYSSHSHSQSEQMLPNCNFSTWSGQESNVYLSRHNLNMCKEWRHQFAKHQQEHRWPNHECMDRSVKAGFSTTYFPQSSQCFCSPFPASGYQCASDKGLNTHPQYAPCRFNPLAQSCPTSVHPLSHSQCQHSSNRQCLINKCLMLFPEQGKPASVTSCPTCHYCTERFSCSTRACQAQSELPSYQSSPSIFNNDCFWHPSEYFEEPGSSEHLHAMKCGGTPSKLKPKKLLWLSEEEAEIIRLIRLSQVKDLSRCSSSYHASERTSPVLSARLGPEVQEEVNLNEARNPTVFSSRVSSSSLEDFASRAPESIISNLGIGELKCLLSEEEGLPIYDDAEALVVDDNETTNQVADQKQRAASCIQHFWRKHMERKIKDLAEEKRLEALKFIFEMPAGLEHLLQTAVTAMKSGHLSSWHASIQRAALVIQHAWKQAVKIKKERLLAPKTLPQDLKELYKLILWRKTNKGITPPSFGNQTTGRALFQEFLEAYILLKRISKFFDCSARHLYANWLLKILTSARKENTCYL
ncbi:hypothetical protein GOP47_0021502 [Adiantum capillus-veneris]|uniref:Uncharacterized protein n=1 Tax=Adiantum capillus-veneris TaxID=13818 RepID=A0A9D4U894_ADICA|nr:hypothetical protein GOP47_0021502 [Adiantum capillus-veneris]